jgi:hypothetical protein
MGRCTNADSPKRTNADKFKCRTRVVGISTLVPRFGVSPRGVVGVKIK